MADRKTTKQVPNPTGKGGFQDHPELRHNGAWKKTDTPRYKLEQMMKLDEEELREVASDKKAPYFERKLAIAINKGDWKVIESMITQVYGQPKQPIEHSGEIKQVDPEMAADFAEYLKNKTKTD